MYNRLSLTHILLIFSLIFFLIIGSIIAWELNKIQKQNEAELYYRLYNDFFITNPTYRGMIRIIDNTDHPPLLTENGGKYEDWDVDDYLGHFELLKNFMDDGLMPEKSIYDSYSYYIIQAYENKEIWKYVEDLRKDTGDSTYYQATEYLAKRFLKETRTKVEYFSSKDSGSVRSLPTLK